jgi:hypothetical protein
MSPRRNLKTTGRWHKKSGRTSKAVISSRNTEHPLAKIVPKPCTSRPAGKRNDKSHMRKALKK